MSPKCPHCGAPLQAFTVPEEGGWDSTFHVACFNDECPYFVRGWQRMEDNYGVKVSYRYRIDPANGQDSPLAVWSRDALKDRILDADVTMELGPAETAPRGGVR
ncbi:MAG: hypothetical protein PVJ73_18895 [Acidobacteriota bacterium]|jgi:hypothetical protein